MSDARIFAPSGNSRSLNFTDAFSAKWLMLTASFSGMTEAGQANLDVVDQLHDHAAFAHAGRLAAQLDRHANLDDLVLGNPREIDVDNVRPPRVPLQVADEGRLVDRAGQVCTSRLPCRMADVNTSASTLSDTHSRPCP